MADIIQISITQSAKNKAIYNLVEKLINMPERDALDHINTCVALMRLPEEDRKCIFKDIFVAYSKKKISEMHEERRTSILKAAEEFAAMGIKDIRNLSHACGMCDNKWEVAFNALSSHDEDYVVQAAKLITAKRPIAPDGNGTIDPFLKAEAIPSLGLVRVTYCNDPAYPVFVASRMSPFIYKVQFYNIGLIEKLKELPAENATKIDRETMTEYMEEYNFRFSPRKDPSYFVALSHHELSNFLQDLFLYNPLGNYGLAQTLDAINTDLDN